MKLSDVMGAANLAGYAEVGLLIFMAIFLIVTIRLFLPGQSRELEQRARMPLEDQPLQPRHLGARAPEKENSK